MAAALSRSVRITLSRYVSRRYASTDPVRLDVVANANADDDDDVNVPTFIFPRVANDRRIFVSWAGRFTKTPTPHQKLSASTLKRVLTSSPDAKRTQAFFFFGVAPMCRHARFRCVAHVRKKFLPHTRCATKPKHSHAEFVMGVGNPNARENGCGAAA
jgi:hypothetical protein